MKKIQAIFYGIILLLTSACSKESIEANYNIVPLPQEISETQDGSFILNSKTKIIYPKGDDTLKRVAGFLAEYIKEGTGFSLTITDQDLTDHAIILKAHYKSDVKEAYNLEVTNKLITVNGSDAAGTFHGIQTLRKSIPASTDKNPIVFKGVNIKDYPRFEYRGMMLDVSRHFFSVEDVKNYIDILALHNINRFHWHLTDDQGWRIEIKKYPELTEIGSKREQTVIGRNTGKFDGQPYGGFYTQEQIRDVVDYAQKQFITIIPEIDLPGHMLAALTAYPNLGCTGGPYKVSGEWGIFEDVLCAGNEDIYPFLENVFSEIIDLFPSEYIHVGGDECPKVRWAACPKCQAQIKRLGLKADKEHSAEDKLQSYVISRIENFINAKGRKIIGWDEIMEGGIAPNATIMSWRGTQGGITAAKANHDVIMTPTTYLYFDYYQTDDLTNEKFGIGGFVPVEKVYSFEPMPTELTVDEQKHIKGVQANMWTEYILNREHLQYMLLPRLGALSEIQWTMPEKKDYNKFLYRLADMTKLYKRFGYNFATHIFDISAKVESIIEASKIVVSLSTFDNAPIYYTLDGSVPDNNSQKYEKPLEITKDTELKAVAIRGAEKSQLYSKSFYFNKATFKKVTLNSPTIPKYTYGGVNTLVDGLRGGKVFSNGEWIGFGGDFNAVIDLNTVTEISEVSIGTYIDVSDWICGTSEMSVFVSTDNKTFKQVYTEKYPDLQLGQEKELKEVKASFSPIQARYVRIEAKPVAKMPDWSQGRGNQASIFVDEISIR